MCPLSGPAETAGSGSHREAGSVRFGLKLLVQHGSRVFHQESVGHSDHPRAASHEGHPGTLQRSRSYPHEVRFHPVTQTLWHVRVFHTAVVTGANKTLMNMNTRGIDS